MPTTEDVIQRIIEQEVYANASAMISKLSETPDLELFDELLPCLERPDYSQEHEDYDVRTVRNSKGEIRWYWVRLDMNDVDSGETWATEREAITATWEDSGDEPPREEALQHWLVSDWLADKLEAVGAMVARDVLGFDVWGRSECGQPLAEDSDILAVASRLQD